MAVAKLPLPLTGKFLIQPFASQTILFPFPHTFLPVPVIQQLQQNYKNVLEGKKGVGG